jgi:NhaP-type Na+/H+ or K+/H+ antiporter
MSTQSNQSTRWSVRTTILCLAVGALVGPLGFKLVEPEVREQAQLIESFSEIALAICLFCVGLRLRAPFEWRAWRIPIRLATATMLGTLVIIAAVAHIFFELSFAQSLLLGAILAPTDPVLASDMPLSQEDDATGVRFSLAAEGALNSGIAYPAVVFSLGLLGLHDPGPFGLRWLTLDVLWSVAAGVAIGWLAGAGTARALLRLDSAASGEAGLPEGLLVLICGAIAYVGALAVHGYGFLAVLAAGIALSRGGKLQIRIHLQPPPRLARRLQRTALHIEHLTELLMVALLGALLGITELRPAMFLFALLLLLVARPLAVRLGLARLPVSESGRRLVEWFGIRGIASVYYLMHSINEGLSAPFAKELTALTLAVLVTSIILHSLSSALPLVPRHLNQEG